MTDFLGFLYGRGIFAVTLPRNECETTGAPENTAAPARSCEHENQRF
ncbi:hypothetical protein N6G02_01930 [Cupriavidus gilardii]|uniref:Uncharacterized protein n=1 Tax=Cupriavidus gilardii TaxID=82541 RepID=A0A6N1BKH7_9BURK|nr:hypothetical protein [Cupriavidus gilardii]QQE06193.1 hypothetical protein IC580_10260 [Cupriavidus sp. ISTL7]MCT9012353.1 hypothetical protein [Cupriavidus gilardii]MCT9053510.1 hypothetical protein [Cupriavidus gilardii]MCT9073461.1 hypothetical protein [Cupriavidus gilardii]MCT9114877.1 hypothetical protein [Cupriavidus gilardii]